MFLAETHRIKQHTTILRVIPNFRETRSAVNHIKHAIHSGRCNLLHCKRENWFLVAKGFTS